MSAAQRSPVAVQVLAHGEGLPLPRYATELAAGCDLAAAVPSSAPLVLAPGARALVPTGLALALQPGFEAQVRPRSGPRLEARHHRAQYSRHHRRRLPRRGPGAAGQSRRRPPSRSSAACVSPSWSWRLSPERSSCRRRISTRRLGRRAASGRRVQGPTASVGDPSVGRAPPIHPCRLGGKLRPVRQLESWTASGTILDVEAAHLVVSKMEDVFDRLGLQTVRLSSKRFAVATTDRLPDLRHDGAVARPVGSPRVRRAD